MLGYPAVCQCHILPVINVRVLWGKPGRKAERNGTMSLSPKPQDCTSPGLFVHSVSYTDFHTKNIEWWFLKERSELDPFMGGNYSLWETLWDHGIIMTHGEARNSLKSETKLEIPGTRHLILPHLVRERFKNLHFVMFIFVLWSVSTQTNRNVWAVHFLSLANLFPRKADMSLFSGTDKSHAFV